MVSPFYVQIRTATWRINCAEKVILTLGLARTRETLRRSDTSGDLNEKTRTTRIIDTIHDFLALLSHDWICIGCTFESNVREVLPRPLGYSLRILFTNPLTSVN